MLLDLSLLVSFGDSLTTASGMCVRIVIVTIVIVTVIIVLIAIFELAYAGGMKRRAVLK